MRKMILQVLLVAFMIPSLLAQQKSYLIHDTRPLITEGPYLVSPSQNGMTIVWKTDTDCHSRVEYGETEELGNVTEVFPHGMLPVGTTHSIRLTNLIPGQAYHYRVVSTRVVKLKAYWPEKGLSIASPLYSFTVPDPQDDTVTFSFLTDTQHEDVQRLGVNLDLVDWKSIDFLVHGGDAFEAIHDENQLFEKFLRPTTDRLDHRKPLVFVRGNHEMRGPFARCLYDYLPTQSGEFYYSFDAGPVHFLVLDTGENGGDDKSVYAGLNRTGPYREQEFAWLQDHVQRNKRIREASFRIILMHAPNWGWVNEQSDKWTKLANQAGVDLVIAGHAHRYLWFPAGKDGRNFAILVVGEDQAGHVKVSSKEIKAVVTDTSQKVVGEISIPRRD